MVKKSKALGRGLGALIEDANKVEDEIAGFIKEIEIDKISFNPYQPRTEINEDTLKELTSSIKELGIIQPITISKKDGNDDTFILISGERRLRAARKAGLKTIPAYIKNAGKQDMMEMALVENIQREDLDAIAIGLGYQRLIEEFKLKQEDLSKRIGKSRSSIANFLRLLKLPAQIQLGLKQKKITMGHARAIININDSETQLMLYEQIIQYDFTVRKVEEIVREYNTNKTGIKPRKVVEKTNNYEKLQQELSRFFDTKINLTRNNKGTGKIVINFSSDEKLQKIIELFDKLKS
ncbi:MAG: ParB/RepB/Spo0J family partition protein [Bacteroidales bacterium]|nr:ParB/RepB/Spo0J family partition protein [Bacteroidales bacterium]